MRKYTVAQKEHIKSYLRKYYLKNKEKIKARSKRQKQINKEHIKKQNAIYRKQNGSIIKKRKKISNQKCHLNRNAHDRNRKKQDINYRLRCNLSSKIWKYLKGNHKSKTILRLIGCSVEYLKKLLESKFTSGMAWENYGKWHIDHIKPCCSFDLSKYKEQLKCFHYTNLQPLWAEENLKKGGRYNGN